MGRYLVWYRAMVERDDVVECESAVEAEDEIRGRYENAWDVEIDEIEDLDDPARWARVDEPPTVADNNAEPPSTEP